MSYTLNSFVNKNEADALKEMIFRRVRERAQNMQEDLQSDVMDIARESFVSKDNPFSVIASEQKAQIEKVGAQSIEKQRKEEIGFPQRELKPRAAEQTRFVAEKISSSEIQNNMIEARAGLNNRKSFIGALDFLNSQAAVSLMRTKSDSFEVVV
jgi:hypothetical protein